MKKKSKSKSSSYDPKPTMKGARIGKRAKAREAKSMKGRAKGAMSSMASKASSALSGMASSAKGYARSAGNVMKNLTGAGERNKLFGN